MKELKINVPVGYEIDQEKPTFENIVFKEAMKNIRERIQTIEDVYALNSISEKEFKASCENDTNDEVGYKLVKLIVSAYNQGKTPDFKDGTLKYLPYFIMDENDFCYFTYILWSTFSDASTRLLFLGSEAKLNMLDAVKKFLSEYKQFYLG